MKVLIALCLATVAVAEDKRFILKDVTSFASCEAKLERTACTACCEESFTGLLGSLEIAGCRAACRILPDRSKRQLLGVAAEIARCEATLSESRCRSCCDSTFTGLLGAVERPACHAACRILPSSPAKRQLIGVAAEIARCEATLSESRCRSCCDSTFTGLLGAVERPACHAACRILPSSPAKRQIGQVAETIRRCERSGLRECISCCENARFTGILAQEERLLCEAGCRRVNDN